MKTIKLYENNTYLRTCDTHIRDVKEEHPSASSGERMYKVVFDETVFFPEGGGQSSDTGRASLSGESEHTFDVRKVTDEGGIVYHYLTPAKKSHSAAEDSEPSDGETLPEAGDALHPGAPMHLTIDWEHRFDNMQRHLGEHIFSGAFYRLFGAVNKGFHMGDDYMTVDLVIPDGTEITGEMIREAEAEANRVIWLDAPVSRMVLLSKEEAEKLPLRKELTLDHYDEVSVVLVGELDDPLDIVACCGTHPTSTGQVGLLKVLRHEPNKGMTRVYIEAGKRAFEILRREHDDLTGIGNELSTGPEEALEKFRINSKKNEEIRDRLYHMKQKVLNDEIDSLTDELGPAKPDEAGESPAFITRSYDSFSTDDVLSMVKLLDKRELPEKVTFVLASMEDNTVILRSNVLDSGKIIKENAPSFGGRGGGSHDLARAKFDDPGKLNEFISAITCL